MVANCELVWREISDYLDGEVNPELRTAMDEHLRQCKQCSSVLAGMRRGSDGLRKRNQPPKTLPATPSQPAEARP